MAARRKTASACGSAPRPWAEDTDLMSALKLIVNSIVDSTQIIGDAQQNIS